MPISNDKPDPDPQRLIDSLSDIAALKRQGVDDEWIQRCADLVQEWQDLRRRFQELEAGLARSDGPSGQDTVVL